MTDGVADDVIVEHCCHAPAAFFGNLSKQSAAPEALFFAGQCRVDDRRAELFLCQQARRFEDKRNARGIVVGARRIAGEIHGVGHAAVDMSGDNDDVIGVAGAALNGEDIFDNDAIRRARTIETLAGAFDREAQFGKFTGCPSACRADAAFGISRRRQGMPRPETDEFFDRSAERFGVRRRRCSNQQHRGEN